MSGLHTSEPVAFLHRPRRMRAILERAQGHVPVGGGDARRRHHRDHRGCRVSGRTARRGDARTATAAGRRTAIRTRSFSATRSKATCTSCSRRTSTHRPKSSAIAAFMDALCRMVVETYDGSLKAEHGTGRNMAPFVELEWGAEAYALMRADQGAVRSARAAQSRRAHQRRCRRASEEPQAAAALRCDLVDKCIECGFCEPKCPSRGLTLSPRQRIVGWREIARLEREAPDSAELAHDAQAVRLPRHRHLRRVRTVRDGVSGRYRNRPADQVAARTTAGDRLAQRVATTLADHYGAVTAGVRAGLTVADLVHGMVGTRVMRSALDGARRLSGGTAAQMVAGAAARGAFHAAAHRARRRAPTASSISRAAPRARWARSAAMTPRRCRSSPSGCSARPDSMSSIRPTWPDLCCGQPFESQGLMAAADHKAAELEAALREASENGRWPIVFDTSPCAYRMQRFCGTRLPVLRQHRVHPRHRLAARDARAGARARSPSIRFAACARWARSTSWCAIAGRCSPTWSAFHDVLCCGFAGDKGFNRPELNEHALRHLKESHSGRLHARLFVKPDVRDRLVRAGGLSVPLDHPSGRGVRQHEKRAPVGWVALCQPTSFAASTKGRLPKHPSSSASQPNRCSAVPQTILPLEAA